MSDHERAISAGPRRVSAVILALCAFFASLAGGCGDGSPPSDREQIEAVIMGFVEAIVDEDAEAACDKLLSPPTPKEGCIPAHLARNPSLPGVYANGSLRISRVTLRGRRAFVVLQNGALDAAQYLRKTRHGWKISTYRLPVRD